MRQYRATTLNNENLGLGNYNSKSTKSKEPIFAETNGRAAFSNITNNVGVNRNNRVKAFGKPNQLAPNNFVVERGPSIVLSSGTNLDDVRMTPPSEIDAMNWGEESDDGMIIEEDWEDIDEWDRNDPKACVEYVNEIYEFLREKEFKDRIDTNLMKRQTDVTPKMRAILVDWLIEVHRVYKLIPETLYLSVNLVDKFLSVQNCAKDKLQLVGITAMLLASKFEEIWAPECQDFVYISDSAYTKENILEMEQIFVNAIGFNLTTPYPLHFLRRFSKAAGSNYKVHTLCKFLIELTLIDVKMLKYLPSEIAAASVYIARAMTGMYPLWNPTLEHYTTYTESDIHSCVIDMNGLLMKSQESKLKAIRNKYSQPKFGEVSLIPIVNIN
eukprot:TRINITY_DN7139_c0_g1_i1.p1 TRINITY_DN7139_c0_g1~~TRINITY_DN7139_c0_g1_i1.p1  ORF type:complete len:384 (+),score=63.41 TRINITY_DN7139_c0_g1_i1:1418-2569(+)